MICYIKITRGGFMAISRKTLPQYQKNSRWEILKPLTRVNQNRFNYGIWLTMLVWLGKMMPVAAQKAKTGFELRSHEPFHPFDPRNPFETSAPQKIETGIEFHSGVPQDGINLCDLHDDLPNIYLCQNIFV